MKGLVLAQADAAQGKLALEKQQEIRDSIDEITDDLDEYPDTVSEEEADKTVAPPTESVDLFPKIFCSDGRPGPLHRGAQPAG